MAFDTRPIAGGSGLAGRWIYNVPEYGQEGSKKENCEGLTKQTNITRHGGTSVIITKRNELLPYYTHVARQLKEYFSLRVALFGRGYDCDNR